MCEVSFCGHATLAAVHALSERSGQKISELGVECAAGNLRVKVETFRDGGRSYWLSMPNANVQPVELLTNELIGALRMLPDAHPEVPIFRTLEHDLILFVACGEHVRSLSPDFAALDRLSRQEDIRGVLVASTDTGDDGVACISRFFAPAAGISEDPVTGSVHGPLAALLIRRAHVRETRPNHWSFLCRQVPANGRVGEVHVRAESQAGELTIEVGGSCVTVMSGQLSP
jgi:PhzF family phenazine biosynthesis protein